MNLRIAMLFCVLFLFGSCYRSSPQPLPQVKLNGINGDALYTISLKGEVVLVTKEIYQTRDFNIVLNRDTVPLGQEFVGEFAIMKRNYSISINSPDKKIIVSNDSSNGLEKFTFSPSNLGVHSYQGQLEYDSIVFPFQFQFIVVDK